MSNVLKGKVAVVSGASRGIGRAIALGFASEGADLAICARDAARIAQVCAEVESIGRRCIACGFDMSDARAVQDFCAEVKQGFTRVDILVNNAGIYPERGGFDKSDPVQWWNTLEVNLRAPYLLTRHLLEHMPAGAKIINMSSGKGFSAGANSSAYHVSKAGLNMLTNALASELWQRQIDVNTLVPGPVATTTLSQGDPASGVTAEEILTRYADAPPAGLPAWERVKHPQEVAVLAVQMARYPIGGPTGQVFSLARRPF